MGQSRSAPPAPSIREELARRGTVRDVGLLLAVPAVLLGVFWLPDPLRDALVFRADDPAPLATFTAHYAHRSLSHLAGNLALYGVAVGLGYPLALLGGRRRAYVWVVAAVLLGYPLALSGLHLSLYDQGALLGASGLVLALVGVLPVVLFAYVGARVDGAVSVDDSPALFFLGGAVIAGRTAIAEPALRPIVPVALLIGTLYLLPAAGRMRRGAGVRGRQLHRTGYVELPAAAVVAFILAVAVAFPAAPPGGDGVVAGQAVHAFAYAMGFVGAFVADRQVRGLGPPPAPDPAS